MRVSITNLRESRFPCDYLRPRIARYRHILYAQTFSDSFGQVEKERQGERERQRERERNAVTLKFQADSDRPSVIKSFLPPGKETFPE